MKNLPIAAIFFLTFLLAPIPSPAVEHPGILHSGDDCSSCHARQTSGKSVHSATTISCTVCHLVQTRGDMTVINLMMPKEAICFACHERSEASRQHKPAVNESCLDCHDSHSSEQRLLLREQPRNLSPLKIAAHKTTQRR